MASVLEKLRSARGFAVPLPVGRDGVRLRFLRPTAMQMPRFRAGITTSLLVEHALPWEGLTEADVLPTGVGGDGQVPFDADLLAELLDDRPQWFKVACEGMFQQINAWLKQQDDAAKN